MKPSAQTTFSFSRAVTTGWTLLVAIAFATAPVLSQEAPQATNVKVAVVDLERIFIESNAGKNLQKKLADLEESTKKQIDTHAKRAQELQTLAAGKTEDEALRLAREFEDEQRSAQRLADNARRQAAKMDQDGRAEIEKELQPIFEAVQSEGGYDLILNKAAGIVIFAGDSIDITSDVLSRMGGS